MKELTDGRVRANVDDTFTNGVGNVVGLFATRKALDELAE